jgi:hypothetical protein
MLDVVTARVGNRFRRVVPWRGMKTSVRTISLALDRPLSIAARPSIRIIAALVCALLAAACPHPEAPAPKPAAAAPKPAPAPPTADEAKQLLAGSPEFSEYEFTNAATTLPLQKSAMNEPARKAVADLAAAGWLHLDGSGAVVFSDKAKHDPRVLVRPNGFVDLVPLAKKELTAVTAVRGPAVDFDWRWIPNDLGASLKSGPVHDRYAAAQHATATLVHDGAAWTVLRIEPRP